MRRRIAVHGATDAALALLPALARRRDLELAWVYDPDARALRRRLAWIEPGAARLLQRALTDDPRVPARAGAVALVIDGGLAEPAAPGGAVSPAAASARLGLRPAPWREPLAPAGPAPAVRAGTHLLARALAAGGRFALLRCDCDSGPGAADTPSVARVRRRAGAALRAALGADGELASAEDGALLAIVPLASGEDASARLVGLARTAGEAVADELGATPRRTPLAFGYALHPDDARSAEALLAQAACPRIRML
jgi:hypothetical protein